MIATTAAVGMLALAAFQAAIALGAPLGGASWGNAHKGKLPPRLRTISGAAILVWTYAALVVLRRGGTELRVVPETVAQWGTWVLSGLLLLGAIMNAASTSRWERYLWAPYSLILAFLCFLLAT